MQAMTVAANVAVQLPVDPDEEGTACDGASQRGTLPEEEREETPSSWTALCRPQRPTSIPPSPKN